MSFEDRKEIYEEIEDIRQRPLISYVTSIRPKAEGQMSSMDVGVFAKQLNEIPEDKEKVDLLIVSYGGDPNVSWRLVSLMRERFEEVGVLLPFAAYSAATLVTLGADEIVMHPYSNLGPVDPQLTTNNKEKFSSEDLRHFIDFIKEEIGISDQEQLENAFEYICKDVGAVNIGTAQRSSQLMISMGRKLLNLHMEDQNEVNAISESLNKSFYHHGYPVGREESKNIGLPVKEPNNNLETKLWKVWRDVEKEMKCKKPFNPLRKVYENDEAVERLEEVPQVQLPQLPNNIPQQLQQEIMQNLSERIMNEVNITNPEPVEFEILQGVLESVRMANEFKAKGKIYAKREPDMSISVNQVITSQRWEEIY